MSGYSIFFNVFSNLNNFTKEVILRKIFSIQDVSCYYIFIRNDKICFRFFSDGIFYQFIFCLTNLECLEESYFKNDNRLVICYICVHDYDFNSCIENDYMSIFVKILLSHNELFIYRLFHEFLL